MLKPGKFNFRNGIILISFLVTVSSCSSFLLLDLSKIQIGMSKEEVIKKIGKPSSVAAAKKYDDGILEIYEYDEPVRVNRLDSTIEYRSYWLHFFNGQLMEWADKTSYTQDFDSYYRKYRRH